MSRGSDRGSKSAWTARWRLLSFTAALLGGASACNEIAGIEAGTLDTSLTDTESGTTTNETTTSDTTTSDTTTSTTPECATGETRPCYSGPQGSLDVGPCHAGVNHCEDGLWAADCLGEVLPQEEVCDGLDNDCDAAIDSGCSCQAGDTQGCYPFGGTAGVGKCKSGMQDCLQGIWGPCENAVGPDPETCQNPGVDDDCDGTKDNVPGVQQDCSTGLPGVCGPGKKVCQGGQLVCLQSTQPSSEACDGLDNDCDGVVDNVAGIGQSCPAGVGVPCSGVYKCLGGTLVCDPLVYFANDFGSGALWTADTEWAIGPTSASAGQTVGNGDPPMDHSPTADNHVAGVVLGGNASSSVHPPEYLTSKAIDINKNGTVFLSFYRWLNTDAAGTNVTLEVSMDDGQTWTAIWANAGQDVFDASWKLQFFDVSPYKSATFKLRFGVAVNLASQVVSSWNIDDVLLASCPAP